MNRIFTLSSLPALAGEFWRAYPDKKIFAFRGGLGAGKTTFIHALCREKKVSDTLSSPSFPLINEYHYPGGILYHLDLYRLQGEEEAVRAGIEDCLYSGQICLVEWPGRAPGIFPPETLQLDIEILDETHRKITITE